MIYTTQELYLKYSNYKAPHIKIKTEVKNQNLFLITRGLYTDDRNISGYKLASYIRSGAYLSFEYVLAISGLIPERVCTYTCATSLENHTTLIKTQFGDYLYQDIPVSAYMYGVRAVEDGDYAYLIASKEKALCDLLYKKKPVTSVKMLKELLYDDLRIDEEELKKCNKEDLVFLCPLYKRKNLNYLYEYVRSW